MVVEWFKVSTGSGEVETTGHLQTSLDSQPACTMLGYTWK